MTSYQIKLNMFLALSFHALLVNIAYAGGLFFSSDLPSFDVQTELLFKSESSTNSSDLAISLPLTENGLSLTLNQFSSGKTLSKNTLFFANDNLTQLRALLSINPYSSYDSSNKVKTLKASSLKSLLNLPIQNNEQKSIQQYVKTFGLAYFEQNNLLAQNRPLKSFVDHEIEVEQRTRETSSQTVKSNLASTFFLLLAACILFVVKFKGADKCIS